MKTLIAVPCMDQVAAPFAQSLAALNKEGECSVAFLIGSLIYESRNNLAKMAIKQNADYVMWFDSDMIFPADTLQRMLRHMEDGKDIVTGVYYRRRAPYTPVLFKTLLKEGEKDREKGGWEGYDDFPKDRLFEIAGCGFGCVIVKKEILLDMMLNYRTWFEPMLGFGEDLSFCIRANELGYKIWCDPGIVCGHVGQTVVDDKYFEQYRKLRSEE